MVDQYPFVKGHGTENDFVLLPDADGSLHGVLNAERVVALCDRRAGIGGDGVIRVIRSSALAAYDRAAIGQDAEWFMDYRNSDGSVSEMCGNGVRVFARFLADEHLADPSAPVTVATRGGTKTVTFEGDLITVDMGRPEVLGESKVAVGDQHTWVARHVDMGNPHAVAFVDDLADAGRLFDEPAYDRATYPHGVNIEFVVRRGERHLAMRVHERGSGETRSCGTGACAAMVAAAVADGARPGREPVSYRVDVPGGALTVTWTADDRVLLTGPAVLVAWGTARL
ncbi:diaminopimelate epimerase [Nocardioides speluncae]|uniref:diaminopimelate epimerase n=1 Tax=Nocardioides speluncae TaxID=2670337 RepID=UPI001F0BFC1B|nr:diaminopimelate epimerase [Nocardioides speluncae]